MQVFDILTELITVLLSILDQMTTHFFGKARVTSAEATCICFGSHRLCHPLVDLKSCCIVNELQVHIFLEAKSNMLPIHSKPRHSTLLRALLWVA